MRRGPWEVMMVPGWNEWVLTRPREQVGLGEGSGSLTCQLCAPPLPGLS